MPTEIKVEKVNDLSRKLGEAKSVYLADFTGLNVASATALRHALRQADVNYEVVKNRLAKLAVAKSGMSQLGEYLNGPTAMAFGLGDPIEPAKILQKFIDDGGNLSIKSGLLDGELLTADQVKEIASLPSRDELLGKVVGSMQGPLHGFVGVLCGLLRNLVGVVAAVQEQRAGSEGETE